MDESSAKPHPSPANTLTSERPPKPPPVLCRGGCGDYIEAEFFEPVMFGGKVLAFSNRWVYPVELCPICGGRFGDESKAVDPGGGKDEQREALIALLGGIKPVEDFTFDKFVPRTPSQQEAVSACREFKPGRENLYLWGKTGPGKTHLACALAAGAFRARMHVCYFKPGRFLRSLRMREPDEHEKILKVYAKADVFVLDDLGVGKATEFAIENFYDLVDMRDMARRHGLVVTSNLSLDQLAEKMGDDRLPSRLAGMCRVIHIEGPDGRLKGSA